MQNRHQLLAIQEPIYSKIIYFIYCPRGYSLLYKVNKITRIYFIISKSLAPVDWAYILYDVYVTVVTICLESVSVIVINIYNLIGNKKVMTIKRLIKSALNKVKKKIILLKDFNAHHPT